MIHPWHDVTPGERLPREFNALVEIPMGSSIKYELEVAINDPEFNSFQEAVELPPQRLMMVRRFFQDYKLLEGKSVEVEEIQPSAEALPIIEDSLQRYSELRRRGFH
jgi:inorganic pyrophosphatase